MTLIEVFKKNIIKFNKDNISKLKLKNPNLEIVIKLRDGKSIISMETPNKLNIKEIKKQFFNKDEFIIFGSVGVRRELIDFYMINFKSQF